MRRTKTTGRRRAAAKPARRKAARRAAAKGPRLERLRSAATAALGLPFADAVRVGDLLYLAGALGNRPGTLELVPGGIEAEARQTLENVRQVLAAAGSGLDRVVRCTVLLADISEWPAFNRVYVEYFGEALPARSAFAAAGLALGARVELEVTAAVGRR